MINDTNKIIDVHVHLWDNSRGGRSTLLAAMERYGIAKLYVSRTRKIVTGVQRFPDAEEVSYVNRDVAQFVKEEKGRIGGYAFINPRNENSPCEIRRCIEDWGMEGIKVAVSVYCDDPSMNPVAELAIEYGVPILIHAFHKATFQYDNESTAVHVAKLAKRYPMAKLIMAHIGGNAYNSVPVIRNCPNVWVDQSGTMFRNDELRYTVEQLGAERVLYGTDMPGCGHLLNYGQVVGCELTIEQRDRILYKNALQVFDRKFSTRAGLFV